MEKFSLKNVLLVFIMLLIPIYAFSQRDYWNDRRRASNNRQQVIKRNMQSWEQQQRTVRQETYKNNNVSFQKTGFDNTNRENEKVVSLVVNGCGNTKEKAIQNALRSAIEQAFGTFVSANTEVLNDELIKDEIATVSSGNIKSYKELSIDQYDGLYDVTVQAIVSIGQLTQFIQSKGVQADLAGASFVMNMKMRELNKKNEAATIEHMIEKAKIIAKNGLFDYMLEIGEPRLKSDSKYSLSITVFFCENSNTIAFYKTLYDTFKALSLTKMGIEEYQKANIPYYVYNIQLAKSGYGCFALRNKYENIDYRGSKYTWLMPLFLKEISNYVIKDNLGHKWNGNHEHLEDANPFEGEMLHFNPAESLRKVNRGVGIVLRDNKRIYYVQKLSIVYTEEELSKLSSITIEHNKD